MPTYDYKCDACEHKWEEFQSIKAAPIKKCPSCGKSKARRQIGGGAGLAEGGVVGGGRRRRGPAAAAAGVCGCGEREREWGRAWARADCRLPYKENNP